jgi:hypothetical protein
MDELAEIIRGAIRMNQNIRPIFIGDTAQKRSEAGVKGEYVTLLGEPFYKIENYDAMAPFFMSIVSSSNHWLFISSTGGLSAGRVSAEQALFPYYTDDKLTENSENTGHKSILLITRAGRTHLWEPFSNRQQGVYAIQRNIYKNITGTALVFEENNPTLGLAYRYAWRTSDTFGFIKTSWLVNTGDTPCEVELVDGLQNILPANVTSVTQNTFSPLLDAYKRSELNPDSGLAIFSLSSILTDLAEPSESLRATTVMQVGLDQPHYLLSSAQLDCFRSGAGVATETEVRGRRCAYFVQTTLNLAPCEEHTWHLLADVQQDSAAIASKIHWLHGERSALLRELSGDIATSQFNLWKIVASADGIEVSNQPLRSAYHFTNVMFNLMRGGIFANQYWIHKSDWIDFLSVRNHTLLRTHTNSFATLPDRIHLTDLLARAEASGSADLLRLSYACLPLTFSRRHGDPSRPWNRFAINIKKPDGSVKIDYEGNWRDIFQNWEALAYSYPEYIESMICTFLNATSVDGYNPYRITHNGIDWEIPEPGNPWANIGYWSDHQIIYLQKLMEVSTRVHGLAGGRLQAFLTRPMFSYANVPYRIKPYADLQQDPYNTIDFDWETERKIEARVRECGTDGKLVFARDGRVLQVTLAEKLLTLLLAKLANFVPEGGIWMNTQRPEWNDANNALVGKGLSVVTLGYLRRTIAFCKELFSKSEVETVAVSLEVQQFYTRVSEILKRFKPRLQGTFNAEQRRGMMDELGEAGSDFRWNFYKNDLCGDQLDLPVAEMVAFLDLAQEYVEHSLRANQRNDHLYHSYNVLHLDQNRATISHLYEMLEGQVAMLSSGLLSGAESLALLQALRNSSLYQADQQSYLLYPDRNLQPFLEKNRLTQAQVEPVALFGMLEKAGDPSILTRDVDGVYHFSSSIRNFQDVKRILDRLKKEPQYQTLVEAEFEKIRALFEETFHHNEFTGRSGTFFAFEGLGSIYWHMVEKLLLAAQETVLRFRSEAIAPALLEKYADIQQGLSFHKSPQVYGAFPADPYSHTPKGQGAKQPGMTGLVKEEILIRQAELGLLIENGQISFNFVLLDRHEFLASPATFVYCDVNGNQQQIELQAGSLAYSICQVPVILQVSNQARISIYLNEGSVEEIEGYLLDPVNTRHIFLRDGRVHHLVVSVLQKEE